MTLRYALLVALLFSCTAAPAQVPGNCAVGRAEGAIDVGDVFARVFNTGAMFFRDSSEYFVPRSSGSSPIFAASLWVGGLADGELRMAGATYGDFEFWPGPLDPVTGRPPDPEDCSDYDRIWRVARRDLIEYYQSGIATRDLAEWPYDLGAPVLDGDGDPTNYALADGDQPAISGDQVLWWVMNDVGDDHRNTQVPPIGLEVQVSAFGFGGGPPALHQSSFYRYRLVNHSPFALDSAYVTIYADLELGDPTDNYVGTDTDRDLAFAYNADNVDGTGDGATYGTPPPAFGVQIVKGPVALPNGRDDDGDGESDEPGERAGAAANLAFHGGQPVPQVDPRYGAEMYHVMGGRWIDGTPLTRGGTGWNPGSTDTTTTMFAEDPIPPRFWSERCPNSPGCGSGHPPGQRRIYFSTGPFRLAPAATEDVLIAMVFGQGTDHLDSIVELRRAATAVRNAYDAGLLDPSRVPGFTAPDGPLSVQLRRPAPNPFTGEAVMSVTLPAAADVRVALVDVLGREVAVLADGPREAGPHPIAIEGAGLAPGVYVARVWVNGQPAGALPLTRR